MKRTIWLAALLIAAGAQAQQRPAPEQGAEGAGDIERRLEAARERLEQAAREVAELSAQLGGPLVDRMLAIGRDGHRAVIGVQIDPASGSAGARVQEVSPGGPAARAGVRAGDVIVAIDGADLEGRDDGARELIRRMRAVEPEQQVKLRLLRDGEVREVEVIARARSAPHVPFAIPLPAPGEHDLERFFGFLGGDFEGMELASLTPKLGQYFGTEKGVLVVRAPDSDSLKLEDGDVILSIDGREPTSGSHATRILRSYQPGEKLSIKVMRERRPLTLEASIPPESERRRVRILRAPEPARPLPRPPAVPAAPERT